MLRHLRWALLWAAVILGLCLIPARGLPEWDWFSLLDLDKLVHAGMFFILSLLLAQAFRTADQPVRYLFWGIVISVLYGVATEFMQGLEALGRRTDPADMIANTVGAIAAAGYATWRERKGRAIVPFAFLRQ
ncbi:MAG TPA: VanZ family protein [Flavobacteriales bacterium]|mgnify:CR=1 FL=1|nr:VanZ family protein [Flavobacteriales bacterium]